MANYAVAVVSCFLLAGGTVAFTVWGHRIGRRRYCQNAVGKELPTAVFDAAVMSLLGLLIAFTFSNAYFRYEKRRDLIVQEHNAISTAYMRLQLLPADRQPALRDKFRDYTKLRYQLLLLLPDWDAAMAGFAAVVAFCLFVIFEIEYPRHGFVTLNGPHELLKQLGDEMK